MSPCEITNIQTKKKKTFKIKRLISNALYSTLINVTSGVTEAREYLKFRGEHARFHEHLHCTFSIFG